jgi:hypothetical protein
MPSLPPAAPAIPPKPGFVQAIAIMCLVDGILSIIGGVIAAIVFICGLVTVCCLPIAIYSVVLGILEIVYAAQVLPDPIRPVRPAKYLAVMQIVNIINLDMVSLAVGILSLVFYNDDRVKEYFRTAGCPRAS